MILKEYGIIRESCRQVAIFALSSIKVNFATNFLMLEVDLVCFRAYRKSITDSVGMDWDTYH